MAGLFLATILIAGSATFFLTLPSSSSDAQRNSETSTQASSGIAAVDKPAAEKLGDNNTSETVPDREQSSSQQSESSEEAENKTNELAINLEDGQQYYDINLFLTNFTEYYPFKNGFQRAAYDTKELIEWAFWHCALNNNSLLEHGSYTVPWTNSGFGANVTEPGPHFSTRLSTEAITNAISRFTGIEPDIYGYDSADWDSGKTYVESEGYVYESTIRGNAITADYVTICSSAEPVEENEVRLIFNVYRCSNNPGVHPDAEWFGYSSSQVEQEIASTGGYLEWSGEAIVEVTADNTSPYRLISIINNSGDSPLETSKQTEAATLNYQSMYASVIQDYAAAQASGVAGTYASQVDIDATARLGTPFSYTYVDISNDGLPELLMGLKFEHAGNGHDTSGTGWTYRAYALFGVEDGMVVPIYRKASEAERFGLLSAGPDALFYNELCIDTYEYAYGDMSQGGIGNHYLLDGTNLVLLERIDRHEEMLYYLDPSGVEYPYINASDEAQMVWLAWDAHDYYENLDWYLVQ